MTHQEEKFEELFEARDKILQICRDYKVKITAHQSCEPLEIYHRYTDRDLGLPAFVCTELNRVPF